MKKKKTDYYNCFSLRNGLFFSSSLGYFDFYLPYVPIDLYIEDKEDGTFLESEENGYSICIGNELCFTFANENSFRNFSFLACFKNCSPILANNGRELKILCDDGCKREGVPPLFLIDSNKKLDLGISYQMTKREDDFYLVKFETKNETLNFPITIDPMISLSKKYIITDGLMMNRIDGEISEIGQCLVGTRLTIDLESIMAEQKNDFSNVDGLFVGGYYLDNNLMKLSGTILVTASETIMGFTILGGNIGSTITNKILKYFIETTGTVLPGTAIESVIGGLIESTNNGDFYAGWIGGQVAGLNGYIPIFGSAIGALFGSATTDFLEADFDCSQIDWEKAAISSFVGFGFGAFGNALTFENLERFSKFLLIYENAMIGIGNSLVNKYYGGKKS